MRRWRVWLVLGLLFAIVGGHLVEVATQREHWPFSPYQMWSLANTSWEMKDQRLYGVTDEPAPREVLLEKPAYFAPLPSRFMRLHMLRGIKEAGQGKPAHLENITRDYLKRYDERRTAGLHNGPPLKGLRLYEFSWQTDKDASNAASPKKTLFFETAGAKGVEAKPDNAPATAGREGGDVDPE